MTFDAIRKVIRGSALVRKSDNSLRLRGLKELAERESCAVACLRKSVPWRLSSCNTLSSFSYERSSKD